MYSNKDEYPVSSNPNINRGYQRQHGSNSVTPHTGIYNTGSHNTVEKWPNLEQLIQQRKNEIGNHDDFFRLLKIIFRLKDTRIRTLMSEICQTPEIILPFITAPASHNHHHSYPGGLLRHSVECAEYIQPLAGQTLTTAEAELTIVSALLHDLGKVVTMTEPDTWHTVSHEVMTLSLLEPILKQLQAYWKQGAHTLRELLNPASDKGSFPKLPGAVLIKMADQYSTSLSARDMAFEGQPDYHYWASLKTPTATHHFNRVL
ncbi:MAG: TraI domain-containing protein [Methyloprofundus sp.]|nr:TraI domain-containing protein [Methyloprofundus sp.]